MPDEKEDGPLSAEARARDEWRGDGAALKKGDGPGQMLPESDSSDSDEEGGQSGPRPFSGTMLPPD